MSDIVRTVDLSKRFRKTVVLDRLNMGVPEGSVYGLVGPNGAGKTTTIKILMNIHPPTAGRAEVFGEDSRKLSPLDFTQIGYVSENQEMPAWMTVEYFLAVISVPDLKADRPIPVPETLEFRFPSSPRLDPFDEIKVIFHRAIGRVDKSARVSIERFVLLPAL